MRYLLQTKKMIMKILKLFTALVAFIMLGSCSSGRGLMRVSDKKVVTFKPSLLTGIYENNLADDPDNSLWQDLSANEKFRKTPPPAFNSQVELELKDEKTLMAYLLVAGERLECLEIKGRIKHDYFIANRKFIILPLIFLNYYADNKTIIGNLENGDLHIVQRKKSAFLLISGDSDDDFEVINADYQRSDSTQVRILKKGI